MTSRAALEIAADVCRSNEMTRQYGFHERT